MLKDKHTKIVATWMKPEDFDSFELLCELLRKKKSELMRELIVSAVKENSRKIGGLKRRRNRRHDASQDEKLQ